MNEMIMMAIDRRGTILRDRDYSHRSSKHYKDYDRDERRKYNKH